MVSIENYDHGKTLMGNLRALLPPSARISDLTGHARRQIFTMMCIGGSFPLMETIHIPVKKQSGAKQICQLQSFEHQKSVIYTPSEIWNLIIFFLLAGIDNRGINPIRLFRRSVPPEEQDIYPWNMVRIYGSTVYNIQKGGRNWHPGDWDMTMTRREISFFQSRTWREAFLLILKRLIEILCPSLPVEDLDRYIVESRSEFRKLQIGPYSIDLSVGTNQTSDTDINETQFFCSLFSETPIHIPVGENKRIFRWVETSALIKFFIDSNHTPNLPSLEIEDIQRFAQVQQERFDKYTDRFKKDGLKLRKEKVTCPFKMRMIMSYQQRYLG